MVVQCATCYKEGALGKNHKKGIVFRGEKSTLLLDESEYNRIQQRSRKPVNRRIYSIQRPISSGLESVAERMPAALEPKLRGHSERKAKRYDKKNQINPE